MRVAFDVNGTLFGPKQTSLLAILEYYRQRGHEIVVWSNSYTYVTQAIESLNLRPCLSMIKQYTYGTPELPHAVDLAFEDDAGQDNLDTHSWVLVADVPDDVEEAIKLAKIWEVNLLYEQKV